MTSIAKGGHDRADEFRPQECGCIGNTVRYTKKRTPLIIETPNEDEEVQRISDMIADNIDQYLPKQKVGRIG